MSDLIESLRNHQKKAQAGISGHGKQLYYAVNEFCAEIYADTGLAADKISELEDKLEAVKNPINYRSKLDAHLYQEYKMISTESELDDIAHCVLSTLQGDCNE